MRILIAMDKFKGSLEAENVAFSVKKGLETAGIVADFDICPIADGGEGTTAAMTAALGAETVEISTTDAQNRPLKATYGWLAPSGLAMMEMSAASGLTQVADIKLKPLSASTLGTGNLMVSARDKGARHILIGIGGSATNDGGLGVAIAMGYGFSRQGISFTPTLETLLEADRITPPCSPWSVEVTVACDVDNPLLGPRGATRVYGPQKGVQDFGWFEARLEHLAHLVRQDLGLDPQNIPGAGAAGGLGFGLMAFANGKLTSGFELIAKQLGLEARIGAADIVITGEGRLDAQSLQGKGPVGVARMARQHGKKIVGVAGTCEDSPELRAAFDLLISIKPAAMPLAEAMSRTGELIEQAVAQHAAEFRRLGELS
jgi:glycerate kinase